VEDLTGNASILPVDSVACDELVHEHCTAILASDGSYDETWKHSVRLWNLWTQ